MPACGIGRQSVLLARATVRDFRQPYGFEDLWRAPGSRIVQAIPPRISVSADGASGNRLLALRRHDNVAGAAADKATRARLVRVVAKAPEVLVSVKGAARTAKGVTGQLNYISRRGALELDGPDGERIIGREAVNDLATEWAWTAEVDFGARANTPISRSMVLSMPAQTDTAAVRFAALDFADRVFGGRYDFVAALHQETASPHVHLVVRALGITGERFSMDRSDAHQWRMTFAAALRARGVEAEATPRHARGVTLKSEHSEVRRMRERHEAGDGPLPIVLKAAYGEAVELAHSGTAEPTPWERSLIAQQKRMRDHYLNAADAFSRSAHPGDRELADKVREFVATMPEMQTQRHRMARELRTAFDAAQERRLAEIRQGLGKGPIAHERGREPER